MKKAPQHEDAPRLVVAVPSLTPQWFLWNTQTGEVKEIIGGNLAEESVYTKGPMPKNFRLAAEDESYHNEIIFRPLPATIEETLLPESPECKVVLMNCKPVQIPEVKPLKTACVVRELPATTEYKAAKMCKTVKFLPLFPDYNPQTQTA